VPPCAPPQSLSFYAWLLIVTIKRPVTRELIVNLGLWIVQILVGAAFTMAGIMKSTRPIPELAAKMPWVSAVSPGTVRFVGVSELLGGIGLILPWALGIARILTPLAAVGLVIVMVLAAAFHARRSEWSGIGVNAVLGGLAAFVAWGRF
jgi:uncharacterized membrane protein YphA (DoxX/SURF4 family)